MKQNTLLWATVVVFALSGTSSFSVPLEWKSTIVRGERVFEVSASTYPWEIHDEGVENTLDNMQQMAGVNSVYLIALMHHEPRPLHGERFPHNPVRRKWYAEDSRVSWHPDLSLYGRIKPMLSDYDWLRDTDWLRVVVDACHKRKLKAGVEISHTVFSSRELATAEYADLIQRNLYGRPADIWGGRLLPCFNHPDVQAYLIALFTDLAKNYNLDYIQTCMVNFSFGDARSGGCFCDSCIAAAQKLGIDLRSVRDALRRNPESRRDVEQWEAFRRKSVTELYRKITDAVHQANPRVEFRLNHWNRSAESGGMYIEDIAPFLGSIRLMSYEEQNGNPALLEGKRRWIEKARRRVGDDLPLLAALGVRNKAYPELIRQGVKVAVDSGVQGITLGHYDGAAFSILRAVRNGLADAGVPGIERIRGVEAERMRLTQYQGNPWAYETCINTDGTASAAYTFDYEDGLYDIKVSYADEKGGKAGLVVEVNEKPVDSWTLDRDVDCWTTRRINNVALKEGDEIKIVGKADKEDWARVDFIEFIPKGE